MKFDPDSKKERFSKIHIPNLPVCIDAIRTISETFDSLIFKDLIRPNDWVKILCEYFRTYEVPPLVNDKDTFSFLNSRTSDLNLYGSESYLEENHKTIISINWDYTDLHAAHTDGLTFWDKDSEDGVDIFWILLQSQLNFERLWGALAHEIGHILIHPEILSGDGNQRKLSYKPLEDQVSLFEGFSKWRMQDLIEDKTVHDTDSLFERLFIDYKKNHDIELGSGSRRRSLPDKEIMAICQDFIDNLGVFHTDLLNKIVKKEKSK